MKSLISGLMINIAVVGFAVADEGHGQEGMGEDMGHADSIGSPAPDTTPDRTVSVTLNDQMMIVFNDALGAIRSGETIQFIVTNEGRIPHEFAIASEEERREHAEMMRSMPGMVHSDGSALTLAPGTTASLTWRFEGDEQVVFSCNIPGHYEAGMFREVDLEQ